MRKDVTEKKIVIAKEDHVATVNIKTISGNVDIDEIICQKLPEHDFMNLYISCPYLRVFQKDQFWKRRLQARHGDLPQPRQTTWKQISLRLGWFNWCVFDWFILGLTENIKRQLTETAKEILSRNSRIWNSGLIAAVRKDDTDLANFFIWKGASCWNEALLIAVEKAFKNMIDLLIRHGANDWDTASKVALKHGHLDIARELAIKNVNDI